MKYHNLKRIFAGFMAAALTLGTTAFVASAQDSTDVTYYLDGFRDGNDYVINITAQGGLINVGALEIDYNTDAFEDVVLTFAENIKDAGFYMGYDGEIRDGNAEIAFMSAAGLSDSDAGLFATNPSDTIAYIDATGDEPVDIATLRFTFGPEYSYDTVFVTGEAEGSKDSAEVKVAKAILHSEDGYNVDKVDVTAEISNMLVFTADDFDVTNTTVEYNGEAQAPTVTSDVTVKFTIDLNGAKTQTNAGEYSIKVINVSGNGYYDANEISLNSTFEIEKADAVIADPANPDAVKYVAGGFDLKDLKIEDWTVTSEGKVEAGTHTVNVKYTGEFDSDNYNYYTFEGEYVSEPPESTVTLTVNPADGVVPDLETEYSATYDATKAQTVAGYAVELSEGWEFVDENTALVIGENKDINVKFEPSDLKNYTYADYDSTLGYVPGKVTVTLNKAQGTAPAAPEYITSKRLESVSAVLKASDFITPAGVWTYTDKDLAVGVNTIVLTYKPDDADRYDYSKLENWNAETEQFEIEVHVEVLKPYISVVVPPENPEAQIFDSSKVYTYRSFFLNGGWSYETPDVKIEKAGSVKASVLYPVDTDKFDVPDNYIKQVIDNKTYIVSEVTITLNKGIIAKDAIKFVQDSVYTGNAIEIDKENLVIKGLKGVDADDVTLVYEEGKTAINAGTYKVYATVAATDNYEAVVDKFEVGTVVVEKADVTKDMFTVTNNSHVYDGTAKSATVTAKDGVSAPTVTYSQENPTVVGEYTITVTGDESANYKAYTLTLDTKLVIEKDTIAIQIPSPLAGVDYVEGGYDLANVSIPNWTLISTGKVNAGTHDIYIKYAGVMDTDNYNYTFRGTPVTSAPQTTVTLTVKKIALPTDAFNAAKVEAVYDGTAKEITVSANSNYTGVGQYSVTYSAESVVNAGTYSATITVAEGTNYLGGTIALADIIVIAKADVAKEDITLANTEYTYDGTAKKATATAKDGMGVPTVTGEGTNAGSYTVTVAGEETTNYNAYSFTFENALEIKKADVAKEDITVANTEYTYDGTAKKATATAKEGVGAPTVSGEGTNAGTYTFTVAGDASANYNAYSFTYENALVINKANVAKEDITLANTEYTYDGTAKKATATAKVGVGAPTVSGEGTNAGAYTVTVAGEATANYKAYSFTFENALKINKATLPADAATVTAKTTEYTGSAITVDVVKNAAYNGLGEFTVAYPEGNINVGTYDVTATFTEGDNYLGGTVTFTNALTITKQVLQNISGPTFDKTEAIVGEEIKNDAGEGFKFAEDYVIKEGNNEIKVTKTIDGDFAKNYDYTVAAEKVGLTVSIDETTGDVTLTKTFNVIGKFATGTVSLKAIALEGVTNHDDVTVTIIPENGEGTSLTFTTNLNQVVVDKAVLTAGKYTLKVKKLRYIEATVNFELIGGQDTILPDINLIPGDIVGGAVGQETLGDGVIDIDDFVIAIRAFDPESSNQVKNAADIDGNNSVNVTDLGYIKANFNKSTADCTFNVE